MNLKLIVCGLILFVATASLCAQTTLNPDISLVGDFRAFTHNDSSRADEREKFNLDDPSMELVIGGYLNPYARADAVLGWHGEESAEIEELYGTILRGLPLGMNLRVGKYLLEFGRLNPVHEHAWSFLQRPLPHTAFFGDHGLSDMSVRAAFLLPTGSAYTEVMAGVLKGDALAAHHHEDESEELTEEETRRDPGFFGRLVTSFATSESAELALGGSVINSVYEVHKEEADSATAATTDQLRAWVGGVDLKYKYKPSRYTALQIEAEGLFRSADQPDGDKLSSYGCYGYIDYRFRQQHNIGGIFEYVRVKETEHEGGEDVPSSTDTWRAGLFVGFAPVEETSLIRIAGHWTEPDEGGGFWELNLQLLFSLGPHQPHNF